MNRPDRASAEHDAGFTLLELLIAITLLGILSVLLFSGLHTGRRAWETVQKASDHTNRIRLFQQELRQELESAYPLMSSDPVHPHIAFEGTEKRLSFLAQHVPSLPEGEMGFVTIAIDEDADGVRLTSVVSPELAQQQDKARHAAKFKGIRSLTFSYFGAAKPGDAAKWQAVWNNPSRLPELVRLRSDVGNGSSWPELIVRPRIDADMACNFDLLTRFCQGR